MEKEILTKYKHDVHPTLNWEQYIDGATMTLAFGYWENEPTAALFKNDILIAFIPKEVIQIAEKDGWQNG